MKAVIQRVSRAEVRVKGEVVGRIGRGLLVLIGIERGDAASDLDWFSDKVVHMRIFEDSAGKMNRSALETSAEILVVSQFTLAASTRRGLRPSFDGAEEPQRARELYLAFVEALRATGIVVATGTFGAMMEVELVNDGPVTFLL